MKISIITVCYNSGKTIEDTIQSVISQTYDDIEYIIIDGGSTDNTNKIIKKYSEFIDVHISEKDNGLYDAMNKGIKLATGDVIGILNSDDVYFSEKIIERIASEIHYFDGVYGDVGYYDPDFKLKSRHYSSKRFNKLKFSQGFMPAHPSCYLKKELIHKVGLYNTCYSIASDFDFILRAFLIPDTDFKYIPQEIVKMRVGGISTNNIFSNIKLNKEIIHSCKNNGLACSWISILMKYPEKIMGMFFK